MRFRGGKPQQLPASGSATTPQGTTAAAAGTMSRRGPAGRCRMFLRTTLSATCVVALLALAANQLLSELVLHDAVCRASAWFAPDEAVLSDAEAFSRAVSSLRAHPFGTLPYNRSMYWGTYRPNVLVGIKNRIKDPLLFGVAWYETSGRLAPPRHETVESHSLLFRWDLQDGRYYGRQIIVDDELHLRLEVDFVKVIDGSGWDVRVSVTRQGNYRSFPLTLVTYFAHEGGATKFPLTVHDRRKALEVFNETEKIREELFYSAADAMHAAADSVGVSGSVRSYTTLGASSEESVVGVEKEPEGGAAAADADDLSSSSSSSSPLLVPFTAVVSDETPRFANRSASWRVHEFSLAAGSSWQFDVRNTPLSAGQARNNPLIRDGSAQRHHSTRYANRHNVVVFKKDFTSDFRIHVALRETSNIAARASRQSHPPGRNQPQPAGLKATAISSGLAASFRTPCQLTQIIASRSEAVRRRFESVFGGHAALAGTLVDGSETPDTASDYLAERRDAVLHMATAAVSNMIGGMGYWHGTYRVVSAEVDELSDSRGSEVKVSASQLGGDREVRDPVSLFSAVPSRAKFPRGFLWDEGFHQLLLSQWDMEMSKDVIAHWLLSVADPTTGWIPREQILGSESRSRVPNEFVAQHPLHANPPALVLVLQDLAMSHHRQPSDIVFLRSIQPRLAQWRNWFYREQCGGLANCSAMPRPFPPALDDTLDSMLKFRWRSRNHFHLLASGLDDYPRPVCAGKHRRELHVDLFSWMALMATTIDTINDIIGAHPNHHQHHAPHHGEIDWEAQLTRLHWDAERRRFADVTGCARSPSTAGGEKDPTYEQVSQKQQHASKKAPQSTATATSSYFSPYDGYVNLFPLLTMLLEDRDKISAILSLAETELMTPYGLMSVSNASRKLLAATGLKHENYWTGPIWLNINFLFLRALKLKYNTLMGEHAERLYSTLRERLIRNVHSEFMRTGKLWENYHWETGRGQGTAPFTGWTALIVAIIGERY